MKMWFLICAISVFAMACGGTSSEPDRFVPIEEVPVEAAELEWKDATEWGDVPSEVRADEFSVSVPFQLRARPRSNRPLVSDWDIGAANRSWELGIDELQRPYLALSTDGARTPDV